MDLYFSPLACSLAARITLYEAGLDGETRFHNVTLASRLTDDGRDYWGINAKGQVPALVTREGGLLTEGPAVVQYIADLAPDTGLAPAAGDMARYKVQQWLNFVSSEVHKQVFWPVFNSGMPPEMQAYALKTALPAKFDYLEDALSDGQGFLVGERFTVADAYLATALNWPRGAGISLGPWPRIRAYQKAQLARPQVARAVAEEMALAGFA